MKCVRIRSYSGPYFPVFGLNTERYSGSLRILSECGKIHTRTIPNTDTFYAACPLNFDSGKFIYLSKCKICGAVSCVGKAETKFRYRLIIIKVNTEIIGKFLRNYFTIASTGTTASKIRIW